MNHRRSALGLISSIAILACNNGSNEGQSAPTASASVASPPVPSAPAPSATVAERTRGPERGPGHGGVDATFFRAAHDLQLSDTEKAKVGELEEGLHDRDTAPRDAMKGFSSDLAAQVRRGKLDASKLQSDEASLDTAMSSMRDKEAKALAGLHDALDTGQRKALVDAAHAKLAAREADARAQDGTVDSNTGKLDRMTSDLGLDPGQQKHVAAILAKQPDEAAARDATRKQMDAILAAFQADSFDAAKALQRTAKAPHDALDRQIALTAQLLPVLHPDQREKLAVSTTKPAEKGGGSGGGGGAGGD